VAPASGLLTAVRTLTTAAVRTLTSAHRGWRSVDAGTAAMVATVAVWGPADVLVTLAAWHLETNPLVLLLGPVGWAASKILVLSVAVWVWWVSRDWYDKTALADVWMFLLALVGAVLIGTNLAVLVGVYG
jgi:hypothetical protein